MIVYFAAAAIWANACDATLSSLAGAPQCHRWFRPPLFERSLLGR